MAEVTNYIDRLVAELCPDGVEYRPLSDVVEKNYGGGTPSKAKEEYWGGDIPWASVGDLSNDLMEIFDTRSKITPAGVSGSSTNVVPAGAVIVAIKIAPGKMKIAGVDLAINQDIRGLVLNDLMNARFLTYYFRTLMFAGHGTIVKSITNKRLMDTEVPVPPLEIQEAIVEILDKFTNLDAELEAELEARTLQYEYYRNSLFESLKDPVNGLPVIANLVKELCPDGVKYSTLKSVSLKTTNIKWERSEEAEYRYIDLSSVPTGGSSIGDTEIINSENAPSRARQIVHTDDILFGTTRPLLDRVVIVPEEYDRQICSTGYAVIRPDTNVVIPSYIYHILREKNFSAYVEKNQTGAAYPAISFKSVMEYTIPLPPLEIQQRIVDILDRFDALTSSLSEGLPAELAARRSQYEYYRDQLLTFPRKGEDQ